MVCIKHPLLAYNIQDIFYTCTSFKGFEEQKPLNIQLCPPTIIIFFFVVKLFFQRDNSSLIINNPNFF